MIQHLLWLLIRSNFSRLSCLGLALALPVSQVLAAALSPAAIQKRENTTGRMAIQESMVYREYTQKAVAGRQATGTGITLDAGYIEPFTLGPDQTEQLQFYTVTFTNLPAGESAYITLNDTTGTFSISMDGGTTYSNSLVIAPNGSTHDVMSADVSVTVRYLRNEERPNATASITHSASGAEPRTLALEGAVLSPLPLRLLSFDASVQQHSVMLKWRAAADSDLSHFELEAAVGQKDNFTTVGVINYSGNEDVYHFVYNPGNTGDTHYFRVVQTYYNHPKLHSKVIGIKTGLITETKVAVLPNPLLASSQLNVLAPAAGRLNVTMHNGNGTEVFKKVYDVTGGENSFRMETSQELKSGLYFLTTELNGAVNRLKVLKL